MLGKDRSSFETCSDFSHGEKAVEEQDEKDGSPPREDSCSVLRKVVEGGSSDEGLDEGGTLLDNDRAWERKKNEN